MASAIVMPKVDMMMETGTFLEWLKQEGDAVTQGEPLFVISTEKAEIEIEAPAGGLLYRLTAKPNDIIPIAQVIGQIVQPGERPSPDAATSVGEVDAAHPVTVPAPSVGAPAQAEPPTGNFIRATPLARGLARQLGLNLAEIAGGGPRGRIHKADIERHVAGLAANRSKDLNLYYRPVEDQTPPASQPISDGGIRERRREPFQGARALIAQRMVLSASTIPHIHLRVQVDMSEAARLRAMVNPALAQRSGLKASYTAIIGRAVAALLPEHPYLNSSLVGDELVLWEDVNLGIAANQGDHLIVPVVRQAQNLRLEQMVYELEQLLALARTRKLPPSALRGGTFTISNLGMLGISSFTAMINPPEAAILAVGQIQEMPVARDGEVVIRPMASLTLAADHRILDGAAVANFLIALKSVLENPYLLI
jgi:pyruvate dehydrogenase E2 component (dihydrolipoamide acetyltransferase)